MVRHPRKDLQAMIIDNKMSCYEYGKLHGLLNEEGWKKLKRCAHYIEQQTQLKIYKAAAFYNTRFEPSIQFGVQVPRHHNEAMQLDTKNGDTKWKDAIFTELSSIISFNAFKDRGHHTTSAKIPSGYKKITAHLVFAAKHDGRRKAQLVAGGHLTDNPLESVYSSVVPLRGVRLVVFIAELNGLEVWCTDVGNAYLESYTKEKVYIIGGPKFASFGWEGHVLFINRALYGLKSSGLMWWDKLADVLRMIWFILSKAESDIWMRRVDDHYELLCVYVDDIIICSKKPQDIINQLEQVHKFSLKGTGPINYHLGCDYIREPNGTLCYGPRRYIDKMEQDNISMFGTKPKAYVSPLEPGDHPEFDASDLLDFEGIKQYQSLIGSIQWAVQLGRFDVATATMTLSA
jgi:Reverse transcriptase (RNA-dependent DNA polymerase)